jgi:hypothetical protein
LKPVESRERERERERERADLVVPEDGLVPYKVHNHVSSHVYRSFTRSEKIAKADRKPLFLRACLEQRVLEGIEGAIIPCYLILNSKGL